LIAARVFFLASAYVSVQELKYAVWGETTEAMITGAFEVSGGRRSGPCSLVCASGWRDFQ